MQRWSRRLHAVNKSVGRRWSPIPKPPPEGADRLCGTHSVLNALRAFYGGTARQHPHRKQLRRLFVRDFSLSMGDEDTNRSSCKTGEVKERKTKSGNDGLVWVPPTYPNLQRIVHLALALHLDVQLVERRELLQLCGERRHQNVVLEVTSYMPRDVVSCPWSDCRKRRGMKNMHLMGSDDVLFLDHIIDPANVGAIMRSAFFMGLQRVVLSSDTADCTAAVSRASTGFMEHLSVYRSVVPTTTFLENTIAQHRARADSHALCIYAATAMPWRAVAQRGERQEEEGNKSQGGGGGGGFPRQRLVLLGNEDKGLSPEVVQLCTHAVHIPSPRQWRPLQALSDATVAEGFHRGKEAKGGGGGGGGVSHREQEDVEDAAVLRPQEVSLNVSAASAIILATLLAGEGAVDVCPIF